MKIFSAEQVRAIDNYTIKNEPIASIDLMERAAMRLTGWFVKKYKTDRDVVIFAGSGNNGGDSLAMSRMLAERQYRVRCYLVSTGKKYAANCELNLERLKSGGLAEINVITGAEHLPELNDKQVIVDGIFGSGLTRKVEGLYAEVIQCINESKANVVSIDIPSGLFGEDNSDNNEKSIIRADYTPTFQFPFLSFFFRENYKFTGEWTVIDIKLHPGAIENNKSEYAVSKMSGIQHIFPQRERFSHKGTYGHALVIAGKYGMMGAAILAGKSALRAGAGLVTVHVPKLGCEIVQTAIPEAIVSIDQSEILFSKAPAMDGFHAVAVGPGIGKKPNSTKGLRALLEMCKVPMVLDADALNIISLEKELVKLLPENSILTPHPMEFDRLVGSSVDGFERHKKQIAFSKENHVIMVLKGAYTGISFPDGSYVFNMKGNPGMATGGSGDVLTGIIVSLLARGIAPGDAAVSGVFLHGLAGDLAAEKMDQEAMIASDIIDNLGEAFKIIKAKPFLHEGRGTQFIAPI